MGPIAISLLLALAFAAFAALAWRKLGIVLALQALPRWDQPLQRLRTVLVNGLLQGRMVQREWRAGLPSVRHLIVHRCGGADDAALSPLEPFVDMAVVTARDDGHSANFEPLWLPFDHPLWIVYSSGTTSRRSKCSLPRFSAGLPKRSRKSAAPLSVHLPFHR